MKPNEPLNRIFEKYLVGLASKEELNMLLDHFAKEDGDPIKACILKELEEEELSDIPLHYQEISNRVRDALTKIRLKGLLSKYLEDNLGNEELAELRKGILDYGIHALLPDNREHTVDSPLLTKVLEDRHGQYAEVKKNQGPIESSQRNKSVSIRLKRWMTVAAALVSIAVVGSFFVNLYRRDIMVAYTPVEEVKLPDRNEAVISFEDGVSYALLRTDAALLAKRGVEIVKLPNGDLLFKMNAVAGGKTTRQTFYSPKGSLSRLVLSDGSRVTLNSDTKLTYPSRFENKRRTVKVVGEAYFEVTHHASRPFVVFAENTKIKVLGTVFNVATNLKREKVLTTLMSGEVVVGTSNGEIRIKPGTQAASNKYNGEIEKYNVDARDVLAWKQGYFRFKDDDIFDVMEKIKTWYDIKEYRVEGSTADRFSGTVLRTRKLSELLSQLEKISNYKFKIIDRRVIVMK